MLEYYLIKKIQRLPKILYFFLLQTVNNSKFNDDPFSFRWLRLLQTTFHAQIPPAKKQALDSSHKNGHKRGNAHGILLQTPFPCSLRLGYRTNSPFYQACRQGPGFYFPICRRLNNKG